MVLQGSVQQSGDFGGDFPGYRWEATTVSRELGMVEIDVQVKWDWRGSERNVALSTLVYKAN